MNQGRSLLLGLCLLAGCSGAIKAEGAAGFDIGGDATAGDRLDGAMPEGGAEGGLNGGMEGGTSGMEGGTEGGTTMRPPDGPPGPPGCGLTAAAFCDHFDMPSPTLSRAGELDATKWSGAHGYPQGPTEGSWAVPIPAATIGNCRSGLPTRVFPDQDALICDPNSAINSRHLLVAAAAQNYGQNSYRIRQPFDFAGRTGHIVFDGEGHHPDNVPQVQDGQAGNLGWISIAITEDPEPAPGTSFNEIRNDEGSAIARNALQVHFRGNCPTAPLQGSFSVSRVIVTSNYVDREYTPSNPTCIRGAAGRLNRFEVAVSRSHVQVFASDSSANGNDFPAKRLVYETDIQLPFERGYVQLTVHNHATLKYTSDQIDAWLARFDNVGFDGPTATAWREYSIPNSLQMATLDRLPSSPRMNVGYKVPKSGEGTLSLTFRNVDIANVRTAAVALNSYYWVENVSTRNQYNLRYRLNGRAWHDRFFSAGELAMLALEYSHGQCTQMLDVPVSELKAGDNVIEFAAVNVPTTGGPPAVFNIDLVLGL